MSRVDELPPDQHAALSVLLRQQRSYAEVAGLLGIGEQAVHDRAHAALAVLAPAQARALDPAQRREIGDYVLGQQANVGERLRTRTLLANSPAAAAWAQALAQELAPLAGGALPEIPTAANAPHEPYPLSQAASTPTSPAGGGGGAVSSRRGGALILAAIAVAAIVVLIVALTGGGGSGHHNSTGSTTSTSGKSSSEPVVEGRFALHSATPHSKSTGTVEVISEGQKRAFYIQAEHIPATKHFFYAIWLYNSPKSALPLSKAPPVGKTHKLAGAALLPSNASDYREILLTRETSTRPTHPGHVVLRGPFDIRG